MEEKYRTLVGKYEAELSSWSKKSSIAGTIKLIVFFAFIIALIMLWTALDSMLWRGVSVCSFIVFFILCQFHERILKQVRYYKELCEIVRKDISRVTGKWTTFSDTGEEYEDSEHEYAIDLDIVGNRSLFQFMNTTHTYCGRKRLAEDLLAPAYSDEKIRGRQKAVEELRTEYEWTAHLEALFSRIGRKENFPDMMEELQNKEQFAGTRLSGILVWIFRIATCSSVLLVLVTKSNLWFSIFGILVLLQIGIGMLGDYRIKKYMGNIKSTAGHLAPYHRIVCELAEKTFTSERLKEIQSGLTGAGEGIRKLVKISSQMKYTANPIAKFLLNALLLWDFKNAFDFQGWKMCYGKNADSWFELFGELESLMSFAGFARNCDPVCLPEISEENGIQAVQIGHPLLGNEERVCNDFAMQDSIVIISGSNMSGKSTFMRTIGINLVLARAGSYVCASQMRTPQMRLLTSMRITDRTTEGISTFYSELLRIRKIIDAASEKEKVFFLIDEIFRGTNSVDRLHGTEGVLKRLHELGSMGVLTTHDLEICKLADELEIINYSFYETYCGEDMYFDYRIRQGISKTTNAEFLLRKLGIL